VIWDLDETFWDGAVIEGGIRFNPENRDIVVQLAQRGIMSSICSTNDFDRAKSILVDNGVWDYFIFPSRDWQPIGPRITALIEQIQLRPPTVMFIDDNSLNLQAALHFNPESQLLDLNKWERDICAPRANVTFLRPDDYIFDQTEMRDHLHYTRVVYHRIYSEIVAQLEGCSTAAANRLHRWRR